MLTYLYSGGYEQHPQLGSYGLDTMHHAELYTMALKYQIIPLSVAARTRLQHELRKCRGAFHISVEAHKINQATIPSNVTTKQLDSDVISFQALLDAVGLLLENTLEHDFIRLALLDVDFSGVVTMGRYRAPWFTFVGEHPEYAADLMMFRNNSQYAAARKAEILAKKTAKLVSMPLSTTVAHVASDSDSSLSELDDSDSHP
jgi:hypothetical protein